MSIRGSNLRARKYATYQTASRSPPFQNFQFFQFLRKFRSILIKTRSFLIDFDHPFLTLPTTACPTRRHCASRNLTPRNFIPQTRLSLFALAQIRVSRLCAFSPPTYAAKRPQAQSRLPLRQSPNPHQNIFILNKPEPPSFFLDITFHIPNNNSSNKRNMANDTPLDNSQMPFGKVIVPVIGLTVLV